MHRSHAAHASGTAKRSSAAISSPLSLFLSNGTRMKQYVAHANTNNAALVHRLSNLLGVAGRMKGSSDLSLL